MTESYSRSANLLGALALAVSDRIREATEPRRPRPPALEAIGDAWDADGRQAFTPARSGLCWRSQ